MPQVHPQPPMRPSPAGLIATGLLAFLIPASMLLAADDTVSPATYAAVGPAFYTIPSYPGAASMRTLFIPYVDAQYANRIYTNASDLLGVYAYKTDLTQIGVAAVYDLTERRAADEPRLHGLENVGATTRLKLFASRTISFVTGDANVATDVTGRGEGTVAQSNLWLTVPVTLRAMVSLGPGVMWVDAKYARTFFSVSPQESLSSALPVYAARAGCVDFHLNGIATYNFSSRWSIGASEYFGRLRGSDAESPIVLRRSQQTLLAWITYKVI